MTELTITPKVSDKTARFKGTIAAGEHVAVTIKGGAEWLGDDNGAHLSLRVIDFVTGRTLALFPRPEETLEDGDEPDAWSVSAEDPDDLFCNLNLNTDRMVNAARHMLRVPVLFVMGAKDDENPATTRTLYFRDRYEVEFWPERVGDDTPYDLDRWPKQIDEWTDLVAEFGTRLTTAETNISQAESRVNAAINTIPQTVATAVAQSNSGKADKVANATNGNLAALDANGNLDDSGKKPSDFADAAQFANHKDNGDIHVTAAQKTAWTAKYDKPSGGIPKSDLAEAVRTSLGKADSAIQEHQSLAAYVNGGVYDGDAKKILLKHDGVTVAEIDATAFIKDGMISEVKIVGDNLVIVFNADAGKESISIPLTQIFNPANFYDKTSADGRFVQKEAGKGLFSGSYNDLSDKPTIPAAVPVDSALSDSSTNPVQNNVVKVALDGKQASVLPAAIDVGTGNPLSLFVSVKQSGTTKLVLVDTSLGSGKLLAQKANSADVNAALALKADASSLPYALVDVTPTDGAPFVLAACFPIVYTPSGGSAVTIAATDAGDLTIESFSEETMEGHDEGFRVRYNGTSIFETTTNGVFDGVYGFATITFNGNAPTEGTTPALGFAQTATLTDRAINAVSLTAAATLVMPDVSVAGHARDLVVRLEVDADGLNITWGTADAGGVAVDYETEDGNFPDLSEAGTYLVRLTETAAFAEGTGGAEDVPAKFLIQCQTLQTAVAGGGQ